MEVISKNRGENVQCTQCSFFAITRKEGCNANTKISPWKKNRV